jgi:hypothetical protein
MKPMIDMVMIERAKSSSIIISDIDYSWRNYINSQEKYQFRLPFEGEYLCKIKNNTIHIEGHRGKLLIDKVCDGENTYLFTEPIKCADFAVFGVFCNTGEFRYFTSEPVIGFHYLGMNPDGSQDICTGDIRYDNAKINSIEIVKDLCGKIFHSFSVCNLCSLGHIVLPKTYSLLEDILLADLDTREKVSSLFEEELITDLL